jgi:hypothetical protein
MATQNNDIRFIHYKGMLANAELLIELHDLHELVRFACDHRIRAVFTFIHNGKVDRFGLTHKGGLITARAEGFENLNDHREAHANGFTSATDFYAGRLKGFTTNEAYQLSISSDLQDPDTYATMLQKGFIEGFDEYRQLLSDGRIITPLGDVADPYRLFHIASQRGFEKWVDMLVAIEKGFENRQEYLIAQELRFSDAQSLAAGRKGGFVNGDEYAEAQRLGCITRNELRSFQDLEAMKLKVNDLAHDARLLIIILSRLPENTVVPLQKLKEVLEKEIIQFQDPETGRFRPWFTTQLHGPKDIDNILRKADTVKEYGTYDHARGEFTSHRLHQRKVVLDGSNVAHNSHGNARSEPTVRNMMRMVETLHSKGFKDVEIIVDAALKHRLTDLELLPDLQKKVARYWEAPPNTSADLFIIQHVKVNHCLMVSNDNFREWKAADPWIEDNIDYYRLTFRLTDNLVLLPELERK